MPDLIYRSRFLIAIISAIILLMSGCKKPTVNDISVNTLQAYFETNILNKTFVVDLAKDTANDITTQYSGYNFILTKTTSFYEGPMTGTKGSVTYTGTWSSNDDYSKLVINLNSPAVPAEFTFLNRPWKFTKKELPVMKLAPWGTTDPKVLYMRRL
ncbi:MAG: hypothetical protein QM791_01645 [Ferruginibacter sp.]